MTTVAALPPVEALVAGVVDYAGLFPPAALDLPTAVHHYAQYRLDEQARMLGRFIVPASRLEEFAAAADRVLPRRRSDAPWALSALVGGEAGRHVDADLDRIAAFNDAYADPTSARAIVDTVEAKAGTEAAIADLVAATPASLHLFVEIPVVADPAPLVAELARHGARAKVRTGGVTAESIPTAPDLARFLTRVTAAGVAFKATAGLHHPVRGHYPLTYAEGSPRALMHGFLNLMMATALLREYGPQAETDAVAVLEDTDPEAFQFDAQGARWRDHAIPASRLRALREQGVVAFGSCSFREPVDELRALRLL